jgi:hypothetical protein
LTIRGRRRSRSALKDDVWWQAHRQRRYDLRLREETWDRSADAARESGAIAALLGSGNCFVTGQRIEVSGGMHLYLEDIAATDLRSPYTLRAAADS